MMKKVFHNRVYINSLKLIFQNIVSLFIGQMVLLLLFFVVLTPTMSAVYQLTLKVTGFRYVTVDNIKNFLLNPVSVLMIILLFYIIGLFLLFEVHYLILFFGQLEQHKRVKAHRIVLQAIFKVIFYIPKGSLRFVPAVWSTLGIFNLPLFLFVLYKTRMMRFVANEMPGPAFRTLIVVVVVGLICFNLLRRAFTYHYYIFNKSSYADSIKNGREREKNRPLRTLLYFLGWNLFVAIVIIAFYLFIMAVTMLFASTAFDKHKAITTFIFLNETMEVYLMTFIFLICTISNMALYTHLFYFYHLNTEKEIDQEEEIRENLLRKRQGGGSSYRKILLYTFLMLVIINLYFFVKILRNGSPLDYMNLNELKVTSHRGFSHDIPENTIPAVERAIEERADYVEVDVRLTKDGVPMLLHDSSLRRTTGVKKNIWDMNYEDVAGLDAGIWLDQRFAGTGIPTLEEVLESCKGRVFLNLDLKYRNPEEQLPEKVVSLIENYEMEWQCVITSTNLSCLEQIKELNPDIRTGYITYQLHPGLIENPVIDFFSMKSNLISKSILRKIHDNGKELVVWTVNSKAEMERLRRIGVDNIITDNPAYAKEVLYQSESDWYFLTLLKIMME